ncbi:MAG: methyltransferase domain-containing protein [Nitrospirae bacterium]|nr:methyltransferase domain-containing protein [Nitrospirota bacterium]
MNHDEQKQKVKAAFDMAGEGYDCPGLRFFAESAAWLIGNLKLNGNENLLDVATGTGHVAIAAVRQLKRGHVTGIDISEKMLQRAISKAHDMNLQNATFKRCDIEDMGLENNTFDAACCAFGLFFLPDMENGLACISKVLKPGGRLAITSFTPTLMMPLRKMLIDRIKGYGVEEPKLSWTRLDSPDKIRVRLGSAGYRDIHIQTRQMGYYLTGSLEWRDVLWNSGYRGLFSGLSEKDLTRFMDEHLKEVDNIADEKGIWLEVEVLLATAVTPLER